MTTRTKTIEFCSSVDVTSVAAATAVDKSIAIYIPETVVAFRSCTVMCYWRGDSTAATSAGAISMAIATTSGFTTQETQASGTPNANSGEHQTFSNAFDAVAFFTTNWSGTTQTWWVRQSVATILSINHSFKLIITYDYDDTSTTHIKTIRIPIESTRQVLSGAMQTIGGATAIPILAGGSTVLPENTPVVRQVFLELCGNEAAAAVTDFTLQLRINGGTTTSVWDVESALNSACWAYFCYDITAETLTSASSLEMQSTLTSRGDNMGGWITVTYEFVPADTTVVWNSLVLGAIDTTGQMGGTTAADADAWGRSIYIMEPTTITLKESAVVISLNDQANVTALFACGDQSSYTSYACSGGTVQCGQFSLVHRIDAGGQNGVAFEALARGENLYQLRTYANAASAGWGVNGILLLNYTSGKHADGVGAHAHSIFGLIEETANDGYTTTSAAKSIAIAETDYWLLGVVSDGVILQDNLDRCIALQAERAAGEGEGLGWENFGVSNYRTDGENHAITCRYASRSTWKRHPGETDTSRLDIEVSRSFRRDTHLASGWWGLWATYHTMIWDVAGTISGSGGGTVNLDVFRDSDNLWLASSSRSGNGAYSITIHNDTENVYVVAYEDATHTGVSAKDVGA